MENSGEPKKVLLLSDIAAELGLSKSTVSRVISGKGRIGESTRRRVLEYIAEHDYQPNAIAQRLATSRTGNLGVVIPADAFLGVNAFFQVCLMGICQEAVQHNYDTVVTSATQNDITYLKRLIARRSVDGVVLMRSLVHDECVNYLLGLDIPFVTIGSVADPRVRQVDIPHAEACRRLTAALLQATDRPVGLIVGSSGYVVNRNRRRGFEEACRQAGRTENLPLVCEDVFDLPGLEAALQRLLDAGVQTLVCGDDSVCLMAAERLDRLGRRIGEDGIALASMYDSPAVRSRNLTAIEVDDMALGAAAVNLLAGALEKREPTPQQTPGYRINFRASTGRCAVA